MMIHVVPKDEFGSHTLDTTCKCSPFIDMNNELIVVHNPLLDKPYTQNEIDEWIETIKKNIDEL